MILNRDLIR